MLNRACQMELPFLAPPRISGRGPCLGSALETPKGGISFVRTCRRSSLLEENANFQLSDVSLVRITFTKYLWDGFFGVRFFNK